MSYFELADLEKRQITQRDMQIHAREKRPKSGESKRGLQAECNLATIWPRKNFGC